MNGEVVPVVVLNWNGFEDTVECLGSLLRSDYTALKVFLLDNGSHQNEGKRLQQKYEHDARVEVRLLGKNLGFAGAHNLIFSELLEDGYPYIALLNNDTVVEPTWLSVLVSAADSGADMVASKMLQYHRRDRIDNGGHFMLNTGEILPRGHDLPASFLDHPAGTVGSCAGAALYRSSVLKSVGCFDPYFKTGYEDAELGLRAFVSGYLCIYEPKAVVYHKMGSSIKRIFDRDYAAYIQAAIWYTYLKIMPAPVILLNFPLILVRLSLSSLIHLLAGRQRYLKVYRQAMIRVILVWKSGLLSQQRSAFAPLRRLSSWQILRAQTFFLRFDLQRFTQIYLRRNPSAFDQYGAD